MSTLHESELLFNVLLRGNIGWSGYKHCHRSKHEVRWDWRCGIKNLMNPSETYLNTDAGLGRVDVYLTFDIGHPKSNLSHPASCRRISRRLYITISSLLHSLHNLTWYISSTPLSFECLCPQLCLLTQPFYLVFGTCFQVCRIVLQCLVESN